MSSQHGSSSTSYQPQQGSSSANDGPLLSLDALISQITSSNNYAALAHTLRNFAPKDIRDTILASTLTSGQDPLSVLDVRSNTLGMLWILSARLHSASTHPPPMTLIELFCRGFDPEQARYSPERVTMLARGILHAAEQMNNPKVAILPIQDLLTRFPPTLSHLTPLHPIFVSLCIQTSHFTTPLPLLSNPITVISLSFFPDLTYNDNLIYHYAGGICFAALKKWREAEEFFECVVSAPGQVPASIQLEALKKLVLVQLISKGKTTPPPKYTNTTVIRLLKSSPYSGIINAYPQQTENLHAIVKKESEYFAAEKNMGLIYQALERAPRWSIKKLTNTYLTLGLSEIGKAVGVGIKDDEEVRKIVLDMIESSEIAAQISASGTVTFFDVQSRYTKADVDRVLRDSEEQATLLKRLELEMARSREYLSKAVRSKEDPTWGSSMDEELMFGGSDRMGGGLGGVFADDVMFS